MHGVGRRGFVRCRLATIGKSGKIMEMEKTLPEVRTQIDALDEQIMALLRQRALLAGTAGKIKRAQNVSGFARLEREAEVLRKVAASGGTLAESSVRAIYREIISACLSVEKPQTIGYLGPAHTFTHEAACKFFGTGAEYVSAPTVRDAVGQVEKELCDFVVLPFENSGEGTVGDTFEILLETPLVIGSEIMLRVRHNLLAATEFSPTAIKTVVAHPQALAQCRRWLERHVPQAATVAVDSNAAAARMVADAGDNIAAIASRSAGQHYNLVEIAADIEDSAFNTTRFLIMGTHNPAPSAADKTSLLLTARDKAGALYHLLEPLSRLGISMSKFESRPSRGQLWQYVFFVDIQGHQQTPMVAQAVEEICARAAFCKVLGSYPRADD